MNLKKVLLCFTISSIIFCSISYALEGKKSSTLNLDDTTPPKIDKSIPYKGQEFIVGKPSIEVYYSDSSKVDLKSVKLYVNYKDVTSESVITEEKISYTPPKRLKRGNQIVSVKLSDLSEKKNSKSYEWYFVVGTPVYNHYRGLLHSHTSATDGHGSFDDAYYLAKYKANLDFFAITEHSNLLDNVCKCELEDASLSKNWKDMILSRDKFNKDSNFLALSGFEMSYNHHKPNPVGHINVYNSNGFIYEGVNDELSLENFYDILSENSHLIAQFNHPCKKFGDFYKLKYNSKADEVISLIEVGNGYNPNMSKNIISFDMYQLALDNGWHLAPTCNQDNHRVDFGIANEFRTVVLSTSLNKDNIFDALRQMRVYATQDKNIEIDFSINNMPMGSILKDKSRLNFLVSALDNDDKDKIQEIQVISNKGEIVKSKKFNSNYSILDFSLKYKEDTFYYVKVIQQNGKTSVTAPIWSN